MNINNTEIFVEKLQGQGNLNFVLIHNAGGNHQFFTHQIEMLKKYGNVIQIDLPGHGTSATINNYDMNTLSDFVIQICKNLSLKNIGLIGLNNGANIVIDIAAKNALPIDCSILIDPPIFMDASFIGEINAFIEALDNSETNSFITKLADDLFIDTDINNKEIAKNAFLNAHKKSLQNIFRGLIKWDADSADILKKIKCRTLCILTDEHHCSYKKLREQAPHFEIGKVIGSKCWATLEVPEQVNAMIERFLKLSN